MGIYRAFQHLMDFHPIDYAKNVFFIKKYQWRIGRISDEDLFDINGDSSFISTRESNADFDNRMMRESLGLAYMEVRGFVEPIRTIFQ